MELLNKSDEELMLMYQNGSELAFQVIYDRHSSKVLAYIQSKVSSREIAHEMFQDVFIKIHKSKHLFNKTFPVLPWVFTITRNTIYDYFRKASHAEIATQPEDFDKHASPEQQLQPDFDLAPALNRLPAQQKQAIELRYYDEKTFSEIADTLNTSPTNIRKIVSRGMKRIKEIIKEGE